MTNLEKYPKTADALAAYQKDENECTELAKYGAEYDAIAWNFEDWLDLDEGAVARNLARFKEARDLEPKSVEEEKEAIRKGMVELKKLYKDNGYEEAWNLLNKIQRLDTNRENVYEAVNEACNLFHTGSWQIWQESFEDTWDFYKSMQGCDKFSSWRNPTDWLERMKDDVGYIEPFIVAGKKYLEILKNNKE